ncbi:PD-(D/E)XK nuclease family protein [Halodesulfurarchaeum sp. HSR-GB]|uniref:PD-(D/E)XK nuclease family protein n=1 Tax=Halodesulfurarchaeum sp. HSR-GB TaxID=3074077 RepID=UPI002865D02C|nr:PD-(D/E)XK nuclease family protein [Halodesulfurarchaeum sp. HSR-GB]MDR5656507.1 PD-(D/E)XK nuclease family protein [Halodesulfurarchaeum sp. HSR-GB]
MPIQRRRPLQAIYDDVRDHDLVIVPNNPLADALNRRLDEPHFGTFATAPRRLATGRRESAEDRTAFLELVDRTDHPWKAIAYAVGNVLQCWEHQGTPTAIEDYPAFVDETTAAVLEVLGDLQTTSGQLQAYETPTDQSVAVVGFDQLTTLERSILSPDVDHVDLFTEEAFSLPEFHVFDGSSDIVDALLDTVTPENAADVGVVLDGSSRYSALVESALEAADIPFYGGPGFADDPFHRTFLRLLRVAHRGSDTTVEDVTPICTQLGIDVPIEHAEKRLSEVDHPGLDWCATVTDGPAAESFDAALQAFERQADRELDALRAELEILGLLEAQPTEERVQDLAYYLQTYDVPIDRENEGVLLADATSAGYVDRPVVFFLGMDEGWTHSAPNRPWVDAEAQYERYIRQFQLLVQSGSEQYYLVQDTAGGQPVTPPLYLDELLAEEFERFSDLDSVTHSRMEPTTGTGFDRSPVDVDPTTIQTISQSSLNRYVNSPRDYLFSRVLDTPDKDYFREGNLFHDFAEFYVNHPERIGTAEIEEIVDVMIDTVRPFFSDSEEPLRRRKYRIGLETIVEYLEEYGPEDHDFLTPATGWGSNFFAAYFDAPVDSPLTERWFESTDIGVKGKIDLVRSPTHLLDYKSGSKKSATQVRKGAAIDPPADIPNFQAALYLAYFRSQQPDERIQFTFFHFLETLDEAVTGTPNVDETMTTVTYYPHTFDAFVASREAYDTLLDGYNDCVETFSDLGFEEYREIVSNRSFPETTEKDELRSSAFADAFTTAVQAGTSDDVDAEKGADQAIRALNAIRRRAFFEGDLDAIEAFVQDRIEEINSYRAGSGRFPIDGPGGEPNYRRIDYRDLLLEGER